ncbi:MAG: hypothetical protein HYS18_12050 [Burkholderiales bacterium]|nr:hypothetical protein [Burkholderiales bacterium]
MTSLNASLPSRFGREYLPVSLLLRLGKRELRIGRDFRSRYYAVSPLIECSAGVEPGHLEILLFRRWLVVFTKAG